MRHNFGGFSWKRLLGISAAKSRLSRQVGFPLFGGRSGRQRKLGSLIFRLLGFCLVLTVSLHAAPPPPISVYVTSVGAVNGFTDPNTENQDSVKDLREKIGEHKGLTLTDTREGATIVLLAERTMGGVRFAVSGAHREHRVTVKVLVHGTELELSATAGGGYATQHPWGSAAGKVIDQLDKWVTANRAKLTAETR